MIKRLKEKYPDEVDIQHTNKDGSIVAHIPIEWMRILPVKKVGDEQRARYRERAYRVFHGSDTEIDAEIED